jgi:hypothetical protein
VKLLALLSMLSPATATSGPRGTDLIVRTFTTALLAIGLVVAVIYESVNGGKPDTTLVGWAGIVIGFYFGGHVATNGAQVAEQAQESAVARAEMAAGEAEKSAKAAA